MQKNQDRTESESLPEIEFGPIRDPELKKAIIAERTRMAIREFFDRVEAEQNPLPPSNSEPPKPVE